MFIVTGAHLPEKAIRRCEIFRIPRRYQIIDFGGHQRI